MRNDNIECAENEINNIIEDIRNGNISDKEIEKAKNKIETRFTYRTQSILFKADLLAHLKCFYDNPELINGIIKKYDTITRDDIIAAAREFLKPENSVILVYLPKK